jgi:hypothetical protein
MTRWTIARTAYIDKLEQRVRVLEVERARHEWLKAQYRALERSHTSALSFIRQHRCSPAALPPAAAVPHLGDNVVDFRRSPAPTEEAPRGTD